MVHSTLKLLLVTVSDHVGDSDIGVSGLSSQSCSTYHSSFPFRGHCSAHLAQQLHHLQNLDFKHANNWPPLSTLPVHALQQFISLILPSHPLIFPLSHHPHHAHHILTSLPAQLRLQDSILNIPVNFFSSPTSGFLGMVTWDFILVSQLITFSYPYTQTT